jgi:hypothetical protein
MKSIKLFILYSIIFFSLYHLAAAAKEIYPPKIVKLGTIDVDVVEASLLVFNDKLFRLYWNRNENNLQIINHLTNEKISTFGSGHGFPSVIVYEDNIYVVGTRIGTKGGDALSLFHSRDMSNWTERTIFENTENFAIFNTSLTKDIDGFTLSMEINQESKLDPPKSFAARFLRSINLMQWFLLPRNYSHGYDRYSAPHTLRYSEGFYYLFYLELKSQDPKTGLPTLFEQNIARSKNLEKWEYSSLNPVLAPSSLDKLIFNKSLSKKDVYAVEHALNINNSDIEFIQHKDKLVILYSWGDQRGVEFLGEAEYHGNESDFLKSWFSFVTDP